MRATASSPLLALAFLAAPAAGQTQKESGEVGTLIGVSILSQSGTSVTHVGVPGDGVFAQPVLYITSFPSPGIMVEPQVGFAHVSGNGGSSSLFAGAVQVGYLMTPAERNSFYMAVNAAILSLSNGGSATGSALGASLGYRMKAKAGLVVRVEGHYRRWLGDFSDVNEIGFGLGFGGLF